MEKLTELWPTFGAVLVLLVVWFVVRKITNSLSDKINNAELYKEDVLSVLEEIREELKQLNRNNTPK